MVAGLIAKELGVELYQVDIARVVSKWIGETERNLAAVFDAAEAGHAILLFIDAAFMRRLSLHVRFDLPDVDEREQLWRAMLPTAAPVADDIDAATLARRFAMSGGYIRNAALRAAFMAADEGAVISGRHLELAAKLEYEGMGKIALS